MGRLSKIKQCRANFSIGCSSSQLHKGAMTHTGISECLHCCAPPYQNLLLIIQSLLFKAMSTAWFRKAFALCLSLKARLFQKLQGNKKDLMPV